MQIILNACLDSDFFIIILRRSLRKGTSSCLGVKESGGNPFQLKAGVSSQPASEIGHFSLQIKKKKSIWLCLL